MTRIVLSLFVILVCLTSCHTEPRYIQLADQEMFSFAKDVKDEYNLRLFGYGGGFFERINSFSLTFQGKQELNVDESRNLFIELSENFIKRVNRNQAMREYLAEYPFSAKNLELTILLPSYSRLELPQYVSAVGITDRYNTNNMPVLILYSTYDDLKKESEVIHAETYEQALEIVRQQGSGSLNQ